MALSAGVFFKLHWRGPRPEQKTEKTKSPWLHYERHLGGETSGFLFEEKEKKKTRQRRKTTREKVTKNAGKGRGRQTKTGSGSFWALLLERPM